MKNNVQNYYLDNRRKMIKEFDKYSKYMLLVLGKQFTADEVTDIAQKSKAEYDALLPHIPYIGGFKNSSTTNLIGSAIVLAYIKVLETYGLTEKAIGQLIYQFFEALFTEKNKLVKSLVKFLLKRKFVKKMLIKRFQKNARYDGYDAAWHTRIVDSDTYDLALDIKQCGICKFYKAQQMENYIKYMCLGDYPMLHAFGLNLYREKTLATSGEVCNYRINFAVKNERAWPPEKMKEWPK